MRNVPGVERFFPKKVRFVVVGMQRTGTTLLGEYLQSHPQIYMGRELFKVSGEGRNVDPDSYRYSDVSVEAFLDDFFTRRCKGVRACGFKVMADQLRQFPQIIDYLGCNGVVCIYLERLNIVDTAVSRLLARQRNVYHTEEAVTFAPEPMAHDRLLGELQRIEHDRAYLYDVLKAFAPLTVHYEVMTADKTKALLPVLKRLGVERDVEMSSPLKKISSGTLAQRIGNADEILHVLSQSKYRPFLGGESPAKSFNDETRSVFVHIPKAAGSSVEKALYGTRGEVGHADALTWLLNDAEHFTHWYSFAFCRHPLDRFVSAYTYLRGGGRNRFDAQWAEKHILPYASFSDFVLALQSDASHRAAVLAWMHFKPQYTFVCDENMNILVDFVGRYESLQRDFATICRRLGLKRILPHENATPQRAGYESYYDARTRAVVTEIYARDFECFGYAV
jgi:LPS sulfotransferase NodH